MANRSEERAALLACAEWMRDELANGVDSPRVRDAYSRLCDRAFDALGDPSMAKVAEIKANAAGLGRVTLERLLLSEADRLRAVEAALIGAGIPLRYRSAESAPLTVAQLLEDARAAGVL